MIGKRAHCNPRYDLLPENLQEGAQRWIEQGIQPGSFLSAVIANNLRETIGRVDMTNGTRLLEIVSWFYNWAPGPCWGSVDRAQAWAETLGRAFRPEWPA